ncbi:hypothetical protein [Paraburkholderia tropica]|uniref:hypothetical protein n=1 Tax=Paraburkholderia tropica TaxID=92647 RepID=UPI002AB6FAC2|nr:hypothetical protein [Paraburkholderia tropica]
MVLGLIERFEQRGSNTDLDEAVRLADCLSSQRANRQTWPHSAWGDNFHRAARAFDVPPGKRSAITTCYVVRALIFPQHALATREFGQAVDQGMAFYRRAFFAENGDVKYYANRTYPLDTHSVAQAVITLLRVGRADEDYALAGRVIDRAIKHLYLPNEKRFVYRRGKYWSNRVNYMRWTQAWAFYALSLYSAEGDRRARDAQ